MEVSIFLIGKEQICEFSHIQSEIELHGPRTGIRIFVVVIHKAYIRLENKQGKSGIDQ